MWVAAAYRAAGPALSTGMESLSQRAKPHVWPGSPDSVSELEVVFVRYVGSAYTLHQVQTTLLMNGYVKTHPRWAWGNNFLLLNKLTQCKELQLFCIRVNSCTVKSALLLSKHLQQLTGIAEQAETERDTRCKFEGLSSPKGWGTHSNPSHCHNWELDGHRSLWVWLLVWIDVPYIEASKDWIQRVGVCLGPLLQSLVNGGRSTECHITGFWLLVS